MPPSDPSPDPAPGSSTVAVAAVWTICFAPLVWIPLGANMWVFGKALAVALAVAAGLVAGVRGQLPRPLLVLGGVGTLVLIASALAAGHPLVSLLGRAPRYEGLPMLALYGGTLWLGTTLAPGSPARRALPEAMTAASLALGVATLAGVLGHNPLGEFVQIRDGSLLGNATDQGLVGLMFLIALAGPALTRRDPLLAVGAVSGAFVVAASGSRAAMLGVLAAVLVLAALRGRRSGLAIVGAPVVMLAIAVLMPTIRARFTDGFSVGARWEIWSMTLGLIRDHPWLGVGPSGYADAIGRYETMGWAHGAGSDNAILNSPHSWPLQFVAIAGLPGLLLALALVVVVGTSLQHALRAGTADDLTPGLAAAVVGVGVGLLVNFTIVGSTAPAMFLLGAALAPAARPLTVPVRRIGLALSALAVAATTSAAAAEIAYARGVDRLMAGDARSGSSAMQLAQRLRPLDPDMAGLAALRLTGSPSTGIRALARGYAVDSLARAPDSYRARLALAAFENDAGDFATALRRLDALVADFPQRALPRVQRARALLGLELTGRARADLVLARRIDPGNPQVGPLLERVAQRRGPAGIS